MDNSIVIKNLDDKSILQIVDMELSPLPKERDSIYLSFYRFFRDTCWVAVQNDKGIDRVVGFAFGFIDQTNSSHCYLNYLFVKSECRRSGIGARLLREFELGAAKKGCHIVTLLTGKQENIDYYSKNGYEVNHNISPWTEEDAAYEYYYNKKEVCLLAKIL
jgi:GNAT superfamily N-acetyltransferase